MKYLVQFCLKYQSLFVVTFATIISVLAIIHFYTTGQTLLYNDARSHLDIARRVTDSLTPGIIQIGSVWLPLYQLLMLPFVQNYFLWHSGLAGAIVSGAAYIAATFFIFKTLTLLTKSPIIILFGTLIFALNPNLLYLQSVPLDEVLAVTMVSASMYFTLSWSHYKYIPSLILAAFFAFLGSLVRYEVWFLLPLQAIYIFVAVFQDTKAGEKLKKAEGYIILFASLAFFGILLWFLYNFLGWGDPLYFLHIPGGHIDQQKQFKALGLLPTEHNLPLSLQYLASNILEDIGPALLSTAGLSLTYLILHKDSIKNKLSYLIAIAPLGFLLLSLYFGITVLFTKIFPLPHTHKLFNVRYGIIALVPAVIIVTAAFSSLKNIWKLKWLVYILMIAIISLDCWYFIKTSPVAVIDDGTHGISAFGQADESIIATDLHNNCSGGLTLISATQDEIIMFESRFPMKSFIYEGSGQYWKTALLKPKSIAKCILISKNGALWDNFTKYPNRLNGFVTIYTTINGNTVLYKQGVAKPKLHSVEKPKPVVPTICTYTTKTGDSLWKIAQVTTGQGKDFMQLVTLNPVLSDNPSVIAPQQKLVVPCEPYQNTATQSAHAL